MKKVLFVVALAAMAAQVGGTEYEVTDAWAGSSNVLPCSKTPQWLVSNADHTLTSGEKAKLDEDSGWEAPYCYYYFEPEPREHDYIVLKFEGVSNYNKLISRWRADGAIATETTRAYCWDGENWDPQPYGVENEGGNNPDPVFWDVRDYETAGKVIILLQTRTEEDDETCFKITWAYLAANQR